MAHSPSKGRDATEVLGKTTIKGKEAWKVCVNGRPRTLVLSPQSASTLDHAMSRFGSALKRLADK